MYEIQYQRNLRSLKQNLATAKLTGAHRFSFSSYKVEKDIKQAMNENLEADLEVRGRLLT